MRIATKKRIAAIFDHGIRWQAGPFRFYRLPARVREKGRVSILIAKKRMAKSVDRNRMRRLIREGWRAIRHDSWDVLITVGNVNPQVVTQQQVLKWIETGSRQFP